MSRHAASTSAATHRQYRIDELRELYTDNHGPDCIRRVVMVDLPAGGPPRKAWSYSCDQFWSAHGLSWWFPRLVDWIRMRGTYEGRTGAGSVAVPINLTAADFVYSRYWIGEEPPNEATIADPDYYRPGFVPTVLGLEQSVRGRLRLEPAAPVPGEGPRPGPARGYGQVRSQTVLDAVASIAVHLDVLVDGGHELLVDTLRYEAQRLLTRCALTIEGVRNNVTRTQCPHCKQVDSVVADDDRAVCNNPICRDRQDRRHCWIRGATGWVPIDEPDVEDPDAVNEVDDEVHQLAAGL